MHTGEPVGIYIHIPFCVSRCRYCDFTTYAGKLHLLPAYVETLVAEIRAAGRVAGQVTSVYFGGGTPSLLSPEQVGMIILAVRAEFACADEMEVTLEANPGTVDSSGLVRLREQGVNRLSLGVQSLDERSFGFLGRAHSAREAALALAWAQDAGYQTVSADMIYGLPSQSPAEWGRDLEDLLAHRPDHISLYGLTIEPNTPLGREAAAGRPAASDDDTMADMYELASSRLAAAGYQHYEISNWCLPGHACKHNVLYWRQLPYLGFGAGAHSAWPSVLTPAPHGAPAFDSVEDWWLARWSNRTDIEGYIADVTTGRSPMSERDLVPKQLAMAEYVILGLRLVKEGVAEEAFRQRLGRDIDDVYGAEIARLVCEGLLTRDGGRLRLSQRGLLLANEVSVRFLPEKEEASGST